MQKTEQSLKFSQYGSDNGRLVIYFHGAPGAPEECAIFDRNGIEHDLRFICFDRFSIDSSITGEAYYQFLAKEISKQAAGEKVAVVGFSIGAFIALQTCRHLPDGIRTLHLVSAAAPLEASDILDAMAGKHVFRLAKAFPVIFILLSYCQCLLALLFPKVLFRLLFASAVGDDKTLAADHKFQSGINKVLRLCFIGRVRGYARDIRAYVRPWATDISEITVKTHIRHGADDNWSPVSMAKYFESAIPGWISTEIFNGLSHYSCLYRAAPAICRQLDEAPADQREHSTFLEGIHAEN